MWRSYWAWMCSLSLAAWSQRLCTFLCHHELLSREPCSQLLRGLWAYWNSVLAKFGRAWSWRNADRDLVWMLGSVWWVSKLAFSSSRICRQLAHLMELWGWAGSSEHLLLRSVLMQTRGQLDQGSVRRWVMVVNILTLVLVPILIYQHCRLLRLLQGEHQAWGKYRMSYNIKWSGLPTNEPCPFRISDQHWTSRAARNQKLQPFRLCHCCMGSNMSIINYSIVWLPQHLLPLWC